MTKRANKRKVEWLVEEPDDDDPIEQGSEAAEGEGAASTGEIETPPAAPPSPGQAKRDEAMDIFTAAMVRWEVAQELAKDAYWDKRIVERRCDAKEARLAAAFARTP